MTGGGHNPGGIATLNTPVNKSINPPGYLAKKATLFIMSRLCYIATLLIFLFELAEVFMVNTVFACFMLQIYVKFSILAIIGRISPGA